MMDLEHEFNRSDIDFILKLIKFIKNNKDINKSNTISINGYNKEFILNLMSKSIVLNFNNGDFIKLSILIGASCKNNSINVEINYKALEYLEFIEKELSQA